MKKVIFVLVCALAFAISILQIAESRLSRKTKRLNEATAAYQLKHDEETQLEMKSAQQDLEDEKCFWSWIGCLRWFRE